MGCGCSKHHPQKAKLVLCKKESPAWLFIKKNPGLWLNILDYLNIVELTKVSSTCKYFTFQPKNRLLYKLSGDPKLYVKFGRKPSKRQKNAETVKNRLPTRDRGSNMTLGKIEESRDEYNFHVIAEKVISFAKSIQPPLETDSPLRGLKGFHVMKSQSPSKFVEYAKQVSEKYTPKFVTPRSSIAQKRLVFQSENWQPIVEAAKVELVHTPSLTDAIENHAFHKMFR